MFNLSLKLHYIETTKFSFIIHPIASIISQHVLNKINEFTIGLHVCYIDIAFKMCNKWYC